MVLLWNTHVDCLQTVRHTSIYLADNQLEPLVIIFVIIVTDSEEGEGEGQSEAAAATDADTFESIADIEEALEKLGQARSLIKAADTKVNFNPVPLTPPSPPLLLSIVTPSAPSPLSPNPLNPPLPPPPLLPHQPCPPLPPSLLPAVREGHPAQACTQGLVSIKTCLGTHSVAPFLLSVSCLYKER